MARFHARARIDGTVERIPFTRAEEAKRDAEEAAWAAAQPERDAEAAREARRAELEAKVRTQDLTLRELNELARLR